MLRPPAAVLLAYRFLGWRVGPTYQEWVLEDITGPRWLVRQGAPVLSAVLLLGAGLAALLDGDAGRVLTLVLVLAAGGAFLRASLRERALRQQGIDASGHPLPTATWYADEAARRRRNLVGAVSTVVLVLAGLTILAVRSAP